MLCVLTVSVTILTLRLIFQHLHWWELWQGYRGSVCIISRTYMWIHNLRTESTTAALLNQLNYLLHSKPHS